MRKLLLILAVVVVLGLAGCTENEMAKNYGGNADVYLKKGEKLILVTWKDSNLWYLTRKMELDEDAEIYYFREESSFGLLEGTVTIHEVK